MITWNRPGIQRDSALSPLEKKNRVLSRRAGAEGMVLLENRGGLPLTRGMRVALFGGGVLHPVIGGTGSGSVNCRKSVTLDEGLRDEGFIIANQSWLEAYEQAYQDQRKAWIQSLYDMSVPGDFDSLYRAHASHPMSLPAGRPIDPSDAPEADAAVYVISRISGEGADRKAVPGDYYASEEEVKALDAICRIYDRVILVLNVGGVMDLSFADKYPLAAILLMSQPGMEAGHALADVLLGKVNPSGHLTDTWALDYMDYPSSSMFSHNGGNLQQEFYEDGIYVGYRYFDAFEKPVRYPFGYGLSYTDFSWETEKAAIKDQKLNISVRVSNTGHQPGRQVLFAFATCPDGIRVKERRRLAGFSKTGLLAPGASETLTFSISADMLSSFHTARAQWYLDRGLYGIYVGEDAGHLKPAAALQLDEMKVLRQVENICPLHDALKEIRPADEAGERWQKMREADFSSIQTFSMNDMVQGISDPGKYPVQAFSEDVSAALKKLSREDKARLVCGQPRGTADEDIIGGAATSVPGAAGQTSTQIRGTHLPSLALADGPAGLRLQQCFETDPETGRLLQIGRYESLENRLFQKPILHEGTDRHYQFCTAIPIGTLLAQTFDLELVRELGRAIASEMTAFGVTLWLAPGMNIHRNPLCGRNFEYYSEDPLVSGCMAAALTQGVQSVPGCGTTIKHFACNNQEENRRGVDSIVSERALREIYLRGFEIAVRTAHPLSIMTSYNKVNSVHTANSYDLCTRTAREEWGFDGVIMTDWLTTNHRGGSAAVKCVAAGNDLIMPGLNSDIQEILDALDAKGDLYLTEKELDDCCLRILSVMERTSGL